MFYIKTENLTNSVLNVIEILPMLFYNWALVFLFDKHVRAIQL